MHSISLQCAEFIFQGSVNPPEPALLGTEEINLHVNITDFTVYISASHDMSASSPDEAQCVFLMLQCVCREKTDWTTKSPSQRCSSDSSHSQVLKFLTAYNPLSSWLTQENLQETLHLFISNLVTHWGRNVFTPKTKHPVKNRAMQFMLFSAVRKAQTCTLEKHWGVFKSS